MRCNLLVEDFDETRRKDGKSSRVLELYNRETILVTLSNRCWRWYDHFVEQRGSDEEMMRAVYGMACWRAQSRGIPFVEEFQYGLGQYLKKHNECTFKNTGQFID